MEVNIYHKLDRIIETSSCGNATKARLIKDINIYLEFFLSEIAFKLENIKIKFNLLKFNSLISFSSIGQLSKEIGAIRKFLEGIDLSQYRR